MGKMKIPSKVIKEMAPFLVVVVLSVLVMPIAGVQVGNNTSRWLTEANHLSKAKGPGPAIQGNLTVRRPLLPLMIAAAFKAGGKSVHSAVVLIRILFALELILIYFIGRVFYNAAVGLLSFGLVLTSFGINSIAKIVDTDIAHPFFILLFVLIYYLAIRRERWIWAILSGVCLGAALLLKETALFCLGLPVLVIVFAPRGKRWTFGKSFLWMLSALALPIVLWAGYIFIHKSSLRGLFASAYAASTYRLIGAGRPLSEWKFLFTTGLGKAVSGFYNGFLMKTTPLALFLIAGWIFTLLRGLAKKRIADLCLGFLVICAFPLAVQLGFEGDRPGQLTVIYMLGYIMLAAALVAVSRGIGKFANTQFSAGSKNNDPSPVSGPGRYVSTILIVVIAVVLIGIQLFSNNLSTWKLWTDPGDALALFVKKPFEIYGRYTNFQEEAAQWLKKNASSSAKIIADGYTNEALDFCDVASYAIPVFHPVREILISQAPPLTPEKSRPLFFFTYSNFDGGIARARGLSIVFENEILASLKAENPRFLVLSGRSLFLKTYFEKASWARLAFDNQRVVVFEVQTGTIAPVPFADLGVNEKINDDIAWLEKNHPDEFKTFLKIIEALGIDLEKIKETPLRIPKGQTY
jgi:hypothetical protein